MFSNTSLIRSLLTAFLLLFLTSCSGHRTNSDLSVTADTELDAWVEAQLLPYLVDRLGRYPRFKNQAVYLAIMDKDTVRSSVDPLSLSIRDRLQNRLLSVAGIKLTWQPKGPDHTSDTLLAPGDCRGFNRPVYYLAIDLHSTAISGTFALDIKALNLAENRWLDGFGMSWRGRLSSQQQRLFEEKIADPALKGTRDYPFVRSEPDLAAAFLGERIGCQLGGLNKSGLIVTVESDDDNTFLHRVSRLMYSHLGKVKAITVTENSERANVIIKLRAENITGNLFHVLASSRYRGKISSLLGAEATTYATLAPVNTAPSIPNHAAPATHPVVASPTVQPPRTTSIPPSVPSPVPSPVSSPVPAQPQMAVTRVVPAPRLIDDFSLLLPQTAELCQTSTPWALGARRLSSGEPLSNTNCLALESTTRQPATLFFLHHDEKGSLTLLADSRHQQSMQQVRRRHFQFPALSSGSIIDVIGGPGIESVYAIASTDSQLDRQLGQLVSAPDIQPAELQGWLEQMRVSYGNSFDWQVITYNHIPSY